MRKHRKKYFYRYHWCWLFLTNSYYLQVKQFRRFRILFIYYVRIATELWDIEDYKRFFVATEKICFVFYDLHSKITSINIYLVPCKYFHKRKEQNYYSAHLFNESLILLLCYQCAIPIWLTHVYCSNFFKTCINFSLSKYKTEIYIDSTLNCYVINNNNKMLIIAYNSKYVIFLTTLAVLYCCSDLCAPR